MDGRPNRRNSKAAFLNFSGAMWTEPYKNILLRSGFQTTDSVNLLVIANRGPHFRLSVTCRSTVGHLTDALPTQYRQSADSVK